MLMLITNANANILTNYGVLHDLDPEEMISGHIN